EEISTGVMWKARVVQWQNAGISLTSMTPTEGALAYVSGFVIPKNSPNKEGAYAYLDAMLDKSAQEAFAVDMGYNPTVSNAVVAPDLNKRIGFAPDEIKKLVDLDYNYLNKNDVALNEWGEKELRGGGGTSKPADGRHRSNALPVRREAYVVALGHDAGRSGDGVRRRRAFGAVGDPVPLQLRQGRHAAHHDRDILVRQLRQVFLRSLLYRRTGNDIAGGRALHHRLSRHGSAARLRAGAHPVAVQERADHAGSAAAVRRQCGACGRMDDAVRLQGLSQRHPDAARNHQPAAADHVYRGRRHCRHHCRQSALHGADIAERDRRHQSQCRGGRLQPWRRAGDDVSPRAPAAVAAGHPRRHHPDLHPRHERLCDAGAARRPQIQDDGAAGVRTVSAQQLAVRRVRRVRPDDGNPDVDGDGKHSDSAPVPAMTIERAF